MYVLDMQVTSSNLETGQRIKQSVQDLGKGCVNLVQDAGNVYADPSDTYAKKDLIEHSRRVNENVRFSVLRNIYFNSD